MESLKSKAFPETLDDEQKIAGSFNKQFSRCCWNLCWSHGRSDSSHLTLKSTMKKLTFWNGTKIQKFLLETLKPATVSEVIIQNEDNREATVVVPDDQLSLAIGKAGQNVRLAVKLTNWKLDIVSESDHNKATNPSEGQSLAEKLRDTAAEADNENETATQDSNESPSAEDTTDASSEVAESTTEATSATGDITEETEATVEATPESSSDAPESDETEPNSVVEDAEQNRKRTSRKLNH